MKRFIYILPFFLLAITGCKKFLDTKPSDNQSPETYYNTEGELNTALVGVYDVLSSDLTYGLNIFTFLEACTDESFYARSAQTTGTQVYNYDFGNAEVRDYWKTLYQGIERANLLITNIDKPVMDENKRKIILAQAKFLRGYYYYLLVRDFGDVPVKTKPTASVTDINIARTPAKDVYTQVLKDMTEAEAALPTATSLGVPSRVSKTTAQGILARVCLTMAGYPLQDVSKYADALDWAKKVKASGEHALKETYDATLTNTAFSQIFINHAQDKYDIKESMWEAEFSGNRVDAYLETGRVGNNNGIQFTPGTLPADDTIGYCYGFIGVTKRLYDLYGAGDLRRDWAIAPFNYNNTTFARSYFTTAQIYNRNPGKWRRSYELLKPKNKNWTPINFPLLRYSDVLLMLAEAENQVNGPTTTAYDAINMVRRRGYGVPSTTVSATADLPAGLSKAQFQQAIQDERARELCFEALRRSDLIRWGVFVTTMNSVGNEIATTAPSSFTYAGLGGKNVSSKHVLFPIPAAEISVNKLMTQNPGW